MSKKVIISCTDTLEFLFICDKINSDDFFDIYESYQEEIELLEKQLSDLNVKTISFKNYSPLNQKEIIGKYVDSVFISKKGTRKNDFKAIVNINQRYV